MQKEFSINAKNKKTQLYTQPAKFNTKTPIFEMYPGSVKRNRWFECSSTESVGFKVIILKIITAFSNHENGEKNFFSNAASSTRGVLQITKFLLIFKTEIVLHYHSN